jgi:curved DNA-binding protein CbpA
VSKTYYEILGVPSNAGEREIKSSYHRLARVYHPDKMDEGQDVVAMEAEFTQISTAYNVLKDPEKRAAYDQQLELKRQQAQHKGMSSQSGTDSSREMPRANASGSGQGSANLDKNRASVARRAFLKGLQFFASGDYSKASEFFEVAVKNVDTEASYFSKLAQSYLRDQRSFSRATEVAQRAIMLDPYNSDYRLVLAEIYEAAGSLTMAIQTYNEILKWDASNERALQALRALKPKRGGILGRFFGKK